MAEAKTERREWLETVRDHTVAHQGMTAGWAIDDLLVDRSGTFVDGVTPFALWWNRLSGRSQNNFRSESGTMVYEARVAARKAREQGNG